MKPKRILERFEKLQRYGCVCCHSLGMPGIPGDIHHIITNGYRRLSGGDLSTIVLCSWHHRSHCASGQRNLYERVYGPSLADGSKLFVERWGTELELLERVNAAISEVSA